MAADPYNPIPSVAPRLEPTPNYRVDAPLASFGGTVAQATQHLGEVESHAGDELFSRAVAMQQLNEQAKASAAVADYQAAVGTQRADYDTLEGEHAVNGFQPFVDGTEKTRADIGAKLDSPYAQHLYDTETRSFRGRVIFSAAGHAATENKKFVVGASNARIASSANTALLQPGDDEGFQAEVQTTTNEAKFQASAQGLSPDAADNLVREKVSKLWVSRIQGMAKSQPFTAQKLLAQAKASGAIQGQDLGRISDFVQNQTRTVGARNIASGQTGGQDLSFGAKIVDLGTAKLAIGQFESGGDYTLVGKEVPGQGHALGKYQIMSSNLDDWLKQSGLPQMDEDAFLHSPKAQDAVFEHMFGGYMQKYGSFNEAASRWFSGRSVAEATAKAVKDANGTTVPAYLANTNAIIAKNAKLADRVAAGRSRAQDLAPDDPLLPDYVEQRVITDHNMARAVERDDTQRLQNTIESGIVGQFSDGKIPRNIDELKAVSPEVESAVDSLPAHQQLDLQRKIVRYNNSANQQTQTARFHELLGMSESDPEGFLKIDPTAEPLARGDMDRIMNLQRQKQKDAAKDPRVSRAMGIVRPLLSAAGIDPKDKELHDRFTGAMWDALDDWGKQNTGKQPDAKQVQELATGLLRQQSSPNFWYGTDFMFNLPLPNDLTDQIKKAHPDASDAEMEMMRREWVRQQFQALGTKPNAGR